MIIDIKFSIGDEVWAMRDNKPQKGVIDSIRIDATLGCYGHTITGEQPPSHSKSFNEYSSLSFWVNFAQCSEAQNYDFEQRRLHHLFSTKKELLDSFL